MNVSECSYNSSVPCYEDASATSQILREQYFPTAKFLVKILLPPVLLCFSSLLWFLYHYSTRNPELSESLPPGSLGLPIIGDTLWLMLRGKNFFDSRLRQYGNIYKTHILGVPVIRVVGAQNAKKILMNENNLVEANWPKSVKRMLGIGSLGNSMGQLHKSKRTAVQKAFNHAAMCDYIPIMQKVVRQFIDEWCKVDLVLGYKQCRNMAFALACEALVGFSLADSAQRSLVDAFTIFTDNLFSLPIQLPGFGFNRGMAARKKLLKTIKECLEQKIENMNSENSEEQSQKDAMYRLLSDHGGDALSVPELMDICLELLFAGHETTASAATSLLINLDRHRNVLARVKTELEEHGLAESRPDDLTLANVGSLKYVNAVVKEVLRVSPPVGAAFRTALKSFTLGNYQIPAGWTVIYSIRETHDTSDIFVDPATFDPDRWIDREYRDEKFHYLPFGGGPRICLGKEFAKAFLRVFVVEIVRSCTWELKNRFERIRHLPVPRPANGLPVRFQKIIPAPELNPMSV